MNKYKKLALNTIIFSIGSFSSKILSVLLLRLYTAYMPSADFSVTSKIQNIINLLGPIASLSISESILRYGIDKNYKREKAYATGIFTGVSGLAAGMVILWITASIMKLQEFLPYMMLFLFTSEFRWMQQQYAKVKNYIKLYTVDSILSTLSLLLFSLLFIAVFRMGIKGYILSIVLSDLFSIIFIMCCADMTKDIKIRNVDDKLRNKMIRYSVPLIPTTVLWWVVSSSDCFMVAKFVSDDVNGLYQVAYRIPNLISLMSVVFFRAWQMSAIAEYDSPERRSYYTKIVDAYTSIMFVAAAGIMLFLKLFTQLLTAESYWDSYKMAPFLVVSALMQGFCNFLSSIYNASDKNKNSLWTSFIAAITNLVLNLILIPVFGVQGAAFATMFSYFVCFLIRIIDTQRIAKYSISWRKIGTNLCIIIFSAVIILTEAKFMHVWLAACLMVMFFVNAGPILQTVKKILRR